jgi:hypothetical protein
MQASKDWFNLYRENVLESQVRVLVNYNICFFHHSQGNFQSPAQESIFSLAEPISWNRFLGSLKVHKHEICFLTFFAETESLWSQGPVTRDF